MDVLILGIGNLLFHDDGLGVWMIKILQERYIFPREVSLMDGGIGGLSLLTCLEGSYDYIIIVDAIKGNSKPGMIYNLSLEDIRESEDLSCSLHEGGVRELLDIYGALYKEVPVRILGAEPLTQEPGIGLSRPVEEALARIEEIIIEELKKVGICAERRS